MITPPSALPEPMVADFLRQVGVGNLVAVDALLTETPALIDAVGPHPFWGGRPQALHVAIETTRRPMFDRLLEAGADVNGRNDEYLHWSPLLLALNRRQQDLARTLIRRGAGVGVPEALALGDDPALARLLAKGRESLPAKVPSNGSLLMLARTPAAIDLLLELGVPTDEPDQWGATPMEALSRLGPAGAHLVRHLERRGVPAAPEVFARLDDRRTLQQLIADDPTTLASPKLLKAAVDFGHLALTEWLLDQGVDPNARSGTGAEETALHAAAWNGHEQLVELLLSRGADPTIRDRQYDATPSGWAATAVEVTDNARCAGVADRLGRAERAARDG
ncbi:MAG: ankyrin repeat domain-containing protein [Gemmatimonadales bacterium]